MPPSPDLAGRRVLVTGATGFLGGNLVRALARAGAETRALVRRASAGLPDGVEPHVADLRDVEATTRAVTAARPELVLHLAAAPGHPADAAARADALAVTVGGTANLLEALRTAPPARLVHAGSSLEYGTSTRPMRESDPPAPVTARGAAKAAATALTLAFGAETATEVAVVRPFSVYGPGERRPRLVPTVVDAALRGEPIRLTGPGIARDFVYVDDVTDAFLLAATMPAAAGEVLNAGTGRQTTNEELAATLAAVLGRELDVRPGEHEARPWDTGTWVADTAKAEGVLGWSARRDLATGLEATLAARAEMVAA
jgi:nucleoside-diphosphate-sugar epimerase